MTEDVRAILRLVIAFLIGVNMFWILALMYPRAAARLATCAVLAAAGLILYCGMTGAGR